MCVFVCFVGYQHLGFDYVHRNAAKNDMHVFMCVHVFVCHPFLSLHLDSAISL